MGITGSRGHKDIVLEMFVRCWTEKIVLVGGLWKAPGFGFVGAPAQLVGLMQHAASTRTVQRILRGCWRRERFPGSGSILETQEALDEGQRHALSWRLPRWLA